MRESGEAARRRRKRAKKGGSQQKLKYWSTLCRESFEKIASEERLFRCRKGEVKKPIVKREETAMENAC